MKILIAIVIILALAFGLFVIFINSGMYNIAATSEHTGLTLKIINATKDNSIRKHAKGIDAPDLSDSAMIREGFEHFDQMCVTCHGAIGISKDEFAKGLYPLPPALSEEIEEWSAAELFWITKHGIKMTGMPAFGDTHNDEAIWPIVAFMQKLPEMSYYDYTNLRSGAEEQDFGHEHEH
ncbi:MAG: cytochrome c [candidate division Zixibacteria bacterium]|nr:cytochrome c [candidate division Zixibacteria bacterium]